MKKIKTADLTGPALNWAAAISLGWEDVRITDYADPDLPNECFFSPAKVVEGATVCGSGCLWMPDRDWSQGGPIIEREKLSVVIQRADAWHASCPRYVNHGYGPAPLVAAMRCFVASKLGADVNIPEELA